jgi:hypothetical protein
MAVLMLAACSSPEERKRADIMDVVERSVQLPNGARHLDEYARYYAFGGQNEVVAVYILPGLDNPQGEGCEELDDDLTGNVVPCSLPSREGKEVAAGQRQWLDDFHNLPVASDSKCGVVSLIFNSANRRVEDLTCVGETGTY